MKELTKDGAKIAEAITVLEKAGLFAWEKKVGDFAQATLTLQLRDADMGDKDSEEEVVVLSAIPHIDYLQLLFDQGYEATDVTCYSDADANVFPQIYARTVWKEAA